MPFTSGRNLCLRLAACLLIPGAAALANPAAPARVEKGNLVFDGIPEIPPAVTERMQQYENSRSAVLQGWDPAGGVYILTRFGATTQVHEVGQPGGDRRQLTFFNEPVTGAFPRPAVPAGNPPGFLYTRDSGGGEFYQIYFYNAQTGASTLLTDGKARFGGILWSHKGDQFVFSGTQRNGTDWDLYTGTPDKPLSFRNLLTNSGAWIPLDWSPDDRRLLVLHDISATESLLFVLDVGSRRLTPIHPTNTRISYGAARWSADGKGVYLASDEGSEFQQLKYYDLGKETLAVLTPALPWDVEEIETSLDGTRLAFTTNEGGIGKLYLLDPASKTYEPVPDLPVGQVGALYFSPDSTRLGLVIDTPQSPADVYVLAMGDHSLTRWTQSEVGGLNTADFVIPTLVSYPAFDAVNGAPRQIPAFCYKPRPAAAPGTGAARAPCPVLIDIHGGPEAQFTPAYGAMVQYLVNELGVAVIAPNVRGSSGYGKSYLDLDNGLKREDSVRDIGALLDWTAKQPDLDPKRVAVLGGSYGGYMSLAALTHYGDRIRAGIDVCGMSNFVTFLEHTEDYRRDLRRAEYGDERDPKTRQFLTDISPLTHADKVTSPLLIVQGLNDPRVPVSEAEQMLAAVRKNGGTAWYLLAKDEGHGFSKKPNRDVLDEVIALFLQQFLLK